MKREQGVTLIEVLIAIVIMALGLIGIAAMQSAAIGNNQLSFDYTQAATATQNMAERMRANKEGVLNNNYLFAAGVPTNPAANCAAALCTSPQQAAWDIAAWYASSTTAANKPANVPAGATANLVGVQVGISCENTPCGQNDMRVITLYWDSLRNGAAGTACDPDDSDDLACFRLPFIP